MPCFECFGKECLEKVQKKGAADPRQQQRSSIRSSSIFGAIFTHGSSSGTFWMYATSDESGHVRWWNLIVLFWTSKSLRRFLVHVWILCYYPTFTVQNKNHVKVYIPYTHMLWVRTCALSSMHHDLVNLLGWAMHVSIYLWCLNTWSDLVILIFPTGVWDHARPVLF